MYDIDKQKFFSFANRYIFLVSHSFILSGKSYLLRKFNLILKKIFKRLLILKIIHSKKFYFQVFFLFSP